MNAMDIIKCKGKDVITVEGNFDVLDAIELLVKCDEGALVVTSREGAIRGILTERDVLRACRRHGGNLEGLRVADLMTREVVIGMPGDSVACMMTEMTERRIRHLPILDREWLAGMISMRDLVEARSHRAIT